MITVRIHSHISTCPHIQYYNTSFASPLFRGNGESLFCIDRLSPSHFDFSMIPHDTTPHSHAHIYAKRERETTQPLDFYDTHTQTYTRLIWSAILFFIDISLYFGPIKFFTNTRFLVTAIFNMQYNCNIQAIIIITIIT